MKLLDWRKEQRYERPAFCKAINEAESISLKPRTLYNWEKGHTSPSLDEAEAIRKFTKGKVPPASFMNP